jgi:hypothetical protein
MTPLDTSVLEMARRAARVDLVVNGTGYRVILGDVDHATDAAMRALLRELDSETSYIGLSALVTTLRKELGDE